MPGLGPREAFVLGADVPVGVCPGAFVPGGQISGGGYSPEGQMSGGGVGPGADVRPPSTVLAMALCLCLSVSFTSRSSIQTDGRIKLVLARMLSSTS